MSRLSKAGLAVCWMGMWMGMVAAQTSEGWKPGPASSYAARQTVEKITIAVEPYRDRERIRQSLGKFDPSRYGILPMLVVISNDSDRALQLDRMRVQWITADRQKIEPIEAQDVTRTGLSGRVDIGPSQSPYPFPRRRGRQKEYPEVGEREFVAPAVMAASRVYGFFYFRIGKGPDRLAGSHLYITGIRDATTGRDLLYFEIPLGGR